MERLRETLQLGGGALGGGQGIRIEDGANQLLAALAGGVLTVPVESGRNRGVVF